MRYQPAYIYPGTKRVETQRCDVERRWQFQRPSFRKDQRTSVRLLRFFLIVIGLALFVVGLAHFATAYSAKEWDKVTALVTKSEVVRMDYDDGAPVFTAKVEYQYTHQGVVHVGERISLRPIRSQSPGEVKHLLAAYSVGRTIVAHVDPSNSDKAYLKTNPDSYLYALILPGLLMVLLSFAIGQALYAHAERKQRKAWRYGEFKGPMAAAA